jgi:hypothetical protein
MNNTSASHPIRGFFEAGAAASAYGEAPGAAGWARLDGKGPFLAAAVLPARFFDIRSRGVQAAFNGK